MLKFIGFHRRLTGFRTKSCLVPAAAKGGKPTESISDWPPEPPAFAFELEQTGNASPLLRFLLTSATRIDDSQELPDEALPFIVTTMISAIGGLLRRQRNRLTEEAWGMSSSRVELLMTVARLGRPTMSELARTLSVTPRAITRLVDGLEADGHVVRERQADDGRITRVRLSDEALERIATMGDNHLDRITHLSDGISVEDLRTTLRVLHALNTAVHADLDLET